ncbi:hypothetical protein RQP46_006560 [Phenoliferia psychrophenolica]
MLACTCRSTLRTPRRLLVALPSRANSNSLSTSSLLSASPPSPPSPPAAPKPTIPLPQSSCVAGTRLTGLLTLKDSTDPIAMEDSEYPAWVWQLVAPEKRTGGKQVEKEARTAQELLKDARRELQRQGTAGIKAANTLKSK